MPKKLANARARDYGAVLPAHVVVGLAFSFGLALPIPAQIKTSGDLTEASLEDLMNVQVTSVSKREKKLARAGAAVFVINQEDIRRSAATNIPDLLRLAPGVDVARLDANRWAISIRGFNAVYANKVLVLIDGRTVYLDSGSNVFWDQQDVPLEDIDHIEVIRGPGGTVWGANAVNGVINIITKTAKATQGGLITAGTGSEDLAQGLVQYGGKVGAKGAYRAFGRYFNVHSATAPDGGNAADGSHGSHGGFRSDWELSSKDSLTVQGDLFGSHGGQTVTTVFSNALPLQGIVNDPIANATGNILGRWNRTWSNGSDTSLQVFYDYNHRSAKGQVDETHHKTDLDINHHIGVGSRNDVVWGLGYRFEADDLRPGYAVQFLPPRSSRSLFSTFLEDEIKIADSLSLTLGSKFEHNAFTGFEYSPSAQLVWAPSSRHTVWTSAARAIKQPSLVDVGIRLDVAVVPLADGTFAVPTLEGSPDKKTEQLRDYEAGYRAQLNRRVSLDVTAFWSFYRRLATQEPQAPVFTLNPGPPHLVIPLLFDDQSHAKNYGGELLATWEVNSRWRVASGYSLLRMSITREASSRDPLVEQSSGDSPAHQFQLRSWFKLSKNLDWDSSSMYVSRLTHLAIPSYVRVDSRVGWRLSEAVEISIAGQNLLRARHMEFSDRRVEQSEVERSVFGKVTWHF